jgi:hypothetical protein
LESCDEALKIMKEFGEYLTIGESNKVFYKKSKPFKKTENREWLCESVRKFQILKEKCTARNFGYGNKCKVCHKRKIEIEQTPSCELIIRGLHESVTEQQVISKSKYSFS